MKKVDLPAVLPVLPVRNTVLFPNAAVPLIVGRPKSLAAIKQAQQGSDLILVVTQKDGGQEEPTAADLYQVGVVCLLSKISQSENDSYQLIANGLFRFEIQELTENGTFLAARGVQMPEPESKHTERSLSLSEEVKQVGKAILGMATVPGAESLVKLFGQIQDAEHIADLCCTFVNLPVALKQELLEMRDLEERLKVLLSHMVKEKERLVLQNEIQSKMMERLAKDHRDHLLREQLKTIHEELGEEAPVQDDFAKKIEESGMTEEARKVAKEELNRLSLVQRSSPEYHVIRTYLDWLVSLPWNKLSATNSADIDLKKAREILEEEHYGIEKVKNRIIQFLAVTKLKKDTKGPILCLLGPPGVGKTSIGKSIATALGRKFVRASLGGVRDEAEIRGHRRTYIGSMPGKILQSMKRVGVSDPLIMLDEIDKIGLDFRGDPASALLEVLDPEQNNSFGDHYLDVPYDLSKVFFITTANQLETIPAPLRDRMEIIEMTSYSKAEKLQIAKRHLLPRVFADHGIQAGQVTLPDETLELVIEGFTREAGVRNLTREIASLCRWAAEKIASGGEDVKVTILPENVEECLGARKFYTEFVEAESRPGVVNGLAWTPVGGEILKIEVTRMDGKGQLILTGQLGEVMKESAQIALSLIRANWTGGTAAFDKQDFHVHVPSGAIPKDGPSAGSALFLALASLMEQTGISPRLAFTGEITLRGAVLPVGGIKEKILAAHRAGIQTVCLPERNRGDLNDVSADVRSQMTFHFVKDVSELLRLSGLEAATARLIPQKFPSAGQSITTN